MSPPLVLLLRYNIAVPTASLGHPRLSSIPRPGHCPAAELGLVQLTHTQRVSSPVWERAPLAGLCVWADGSALRGQTESSRALTGYKEVSDME